MQVPVVCLHHLLEFTIKAQHDGLRKLRRDNQAACQAFLCQELKQTEDWAFSGGYSPALAPTRRQPAAEPLINAPCVIFCYFPSGVRSLLSHPLHGYITASPFLLSDPSLPAKYGTVVLSPS